MTKSTEAACLGIAIANTYSSDALSPNYSKRNQPEPDSRASLIRWKRKCQPEVQFFLDEIGTGSIGLNNLPFLLKPQASRVFSTTNVHVGLFVEADSGCMKIKKLGLHH